MGEENTAHKRYVPSTTTRERRAETESQEKRITLGALVHCTRPHRHLKEGREPSSNSRGQEVRLADVRRAVKSRR